MDGLSKGGVKDKFFVNGHTNPMWGGILISAVDLFSVYLYSSMVYICI